MLIYHVPNLGSYWAGSPRIIAPVSTISYLLSYSNIYLWLFGSAFIVIFVKGIQRSKKRASTIINIWLFMIFAVIYMIMPIFIYSKFINQSGSFYVHRYFFAIMPFVFLIAAYAIAEIANTNSNFLGLIFIILMFCSSGFQSYHQAFSNISAIREPYREAAEYLAQDERVYTDDALIISSVGYSVGSGWIEYYFKKRGFRIPKNVAVAASADKLLLFIAGDEYIEPKLINEDEFLKYKHLYLFEVHSAFSESLINTIKKEYLVVEEISVIREKSFIRKFRENVLHHPPRTDQIPNLLKVYSK
jgi:hypothetical protein